jgi:hypothetical protein
MIPSTTITTTTTTTMLHRSLLESRNSKYNRRKEFWVLVVVVFLLPTLMVYILRFSQMIGYILQYHENLELHGEHFAIPSQRLLLMKRNDSLSFSYSYGRHPVLHDSVRTIQEHMKTSNMSVLSPFQQDDHTDSTKIHSSRPYFILHVGPPKTATTSIQCGLNQHSQRLADYDNYIYLGRSCPHTPETMPNGEDPIKPFDFIKALGHVSSGVNETFLQETRQRFLRHRRLGHHLIFSTEHISSKPSMHVSNPLVWKRLLQGFQVKIVVGYRHFFEWYPSYYYQSHIGSRFCFYWPQDGGSTIPSLVEYMEDHLNRWQGSRNDDNPRESDRLATHMSLWTYRIWSQHFDNVYLLDLHQSGEDVLVQFLCHALPSANHTCKYLQQVNDINNSNNLTVNVKMTQRVSSNLFPERIVDTALQWGMINNTQARKKPYFAKKVRDMLDAMKLLVNNSSNDNDDDHDDNYWWCPSLALRDRIHKASLFYLQSLHQMVNSSSISQPRLLYGTNWTLAVQAHDRLFQTAQQKRKFCDVNTSRVLQNVHFTRHVFGRVGLQVLHQRLQQLSDNVGNVTHAIQDKEVMQLPS